MATPPRSCCRSRPHPGPSPRRCKSGIEASGPLARAVAACIEAGDHRAAIVRDAPRGLLGRASGIESRLIQRPAVALVTIVLCLRIALTVAGIQVHARAAPAATAAAVLCGAAICAIG